MKQMKDKKRKQMNSGREREEKGKVENMIIKENKRKQYGGKVDKKEKVKGKRGKGER